MNLRYRFTTFKENAKNKLTPEVETYGININIRNLAKRIKKWAMQLNR